MTHLGNKALAQAWIAPTLQTPKKGLSLQHQPLASSWDRSPKVNVSPCA